MAEEQRAPQESGIFEPKPLPAKHKVKSGAQKATELLIVVGVLVVIGLVALYCRGLYMKPVRSYYKALAKLNAAKMVDSFPVFLRDAESDGESMTVYDMCSFVAASAKTEYGTQFKTDVTLLSYEEKDAEYLQKLEEGIKAEYLRDVDVSAGRWLTVTVNYEYGDAENTVTEYVRVYKINGKWVMLDVPSGEE